jgi:hypothetical protein
MSARRALAKQFGMQNLYQLPRDILGPDDLRLAADAFEAALHAIDEGTCETSAHVTRRLLARYVIERALGGEREVAALCDGALAYVSTQAAETA